MRLRIIKEADSKLLEYKPIYVEEPNNYKGKWHELFKNSNRIYLEIGMGKGQFLIEQASKNPQINFIGIEVSATVALRAAKKIKKAKLENIHIMNIDAIEIAECFENAEVGKIYLNFSDPWPKNRHDKRRLTYYKFLEKYDLVLDKDGQIEFKTDNYKLFLFSVISFNNYGLKFLDLSFDLHNDFDDVITTEYEDKFISMKKPIYYIKARKNNEDKK
ncbi:MAG TPA: tRNA (guanosine(46)-N7)-methyltransferase TrmB [Acholeplasmataceae bacterium]|nr:tRNA (guanosine(46)-N7)-methyltransferase TrmB [Acholeplasmataceae bacterium]